MYFVYIEEEAPLISGYLYRRVTLKSFFNSVQEDLVVTSAGLTYGVERAGSLSMSLPSSHRYVNMFPDFDVIVRIVENDRLVWRGRFLSYQRNFDLSTDVTFEGLFARMNDVPIAPYDYSTSGISMDDLFNSIWTEYEKIFYPGKTISFARMPTIACTDEMRSRKYYGKNDDWTSAMEVYSGIIDELRDLTFIVHEGAEEEMPVGPNETAPIPRDFVIEIMDDKTMAKSTGQQIRFGTNLLDLTKIFDGSEIYSRLIPVGKDGLTIGSPNYISDPEIESKYGVRYKVVNFSDIEDTATLKSLGQQLYTKNQEELSSTGVEVRAVDMHYLDSSIEGFKFGELVHVASEVQGVDDWYPLTNMELNLLDPQQNSYTFGYEQKQISTEVANK